MLTTLTQADWPRLKALLDAAPLETIFLSSRVERFGLDADKLGCPVIGVTRAGALVGAVHAGANLMPVGDPDALDEIIERLGPRVRTQSILGPAALVRRLYTGLVQRWGTTWAAPRDLRWHQPLMVWRRDGPLPIAADPRVRQMTTDDLDPYYDAAVRMYTEEVGGSPVDASDSYRQYVRYLITNRRAFGASDGRRVWYKTDIGATYQGICQVQGVWLDPALRGHGLAEGLMAGVLQLIDPGWTTVSLYVNDYNVRARHMYDRLGFAVVGELATVLY